MEKYIEELKTKIPEALYDNISEKLAADQCYSIWQYRLECVQEMADAWEELNGENLVWVPGHYETKTSTDDTTYIGPPLSYPYYHLCYYDKDGCFDEEFGKEDRLFDFLGALFAQNILDKDNPQDEIARLYYHVGKFNTYEITLIPDIESSLQPGNSNAVTGIEWNGRLCRLEANLVDLFIWDKVNQKFAKNDTMRILFGNKTFCELKVVATR